MILKACPIALHPDGTPRRIAAFSHPQAGAQLVKGTIEPGEVPARAAARELFEESGLETRTAMSIGQSDQIVADETWHFVLCRIVPPVREAWQHHCADDGGHLFRFFWQPLDTDMPPEFGLPFQNAVRWIRANL